MNLATVAAWVGGVLGAFLLGSVNPATIITTMTKIVCALIILSFNDSPATGQPRSNRRP